MSAGSDSIFKNLRAHFTKASNKWNANSVATAWRTGRKLKMADNKNKLGYEFLKQRTQCGKVFVAREECEESRADLWGFVKSRAHKGMTFVVIGLLAVLISVGVGQFYWTQRLHGRQEEKIHRLEVDTALQLKELQAQQVLIIQGIADLRKDVRVLTERVTEGR